MNKSLPNIILISIDTLRYDRLTLPGESTKGIIPVLDNFVQKNILCTRAYSASTFTAPANASIFTGLYPVEHGILDFNSHLSYSGLQVIKSMGYSTVAIVTYRIFCSMLKGHFDEIINITDLTDKRFDMAEMVVDNVKKWIARKNPGPFFLFIHLEGPHAPYRLPENMFNSLKDVYYRMTPIVRESIIYDRKSSNQRETSKFRKFLRKINRFEIKLKDEDLKGIKTFYNAQAKYHDDNLGKIFDLLKAKKLFDESVIIIYSDHGEAFLEHGKIGHGCNALHEEIIKTILTFSFPEYPGSMFLDEPVSHVQIFPTILEYIGSDNILFPAERSLIRLIMKGENKYLTNIFCEDRYKISVIQNDMKLIKYKYRINTRNKKSAKLLSKMMIERIFNRIQFKELYDLKRDPQEKVNLYKMNKNKVKYFEKLLYNYFSIQKDNKIKKYLDIMSNEYKKSNFYMDENEKAKLHMQLRELGYM